MPILEVVKVHWLDHEFNFEACLVYGGALTTSTLQNISR